MNANTILAYSGGTGRNQIAKLNLASTVETAFSLNTDNGAGAPAFLSLPLQSAILGSSTPIDPTANPAITVGGGRQFGPPNGSGAPYINSGSFDGAHPFRVRLVGTGNAGANAGQTVVINVYEGTSTTLASNAKIATTGAALATAAGGPFNFLVNIECIWDSVTQVLGGTFQALINYTNKAGSQLNATGLLTNFAAPTSVAGISFIPSVQFGNAAASSVSVTEFALEQV